MRIGIDFDNTIACYDGVFYAAALERGLIPADLPEDKTSVRNYLRGLDRDNEFTLLQGYVYGQRMDLVSPYPGFRESLGRLHKAGHALFIVSHKTKSPFAGPAYDLHAAARGFLDIQKFSAASGGPFEPSSVFFELTKEEKIERVRALECEVFIDDLPEILSMDGFPNSIRKILFDPDGHHAAETQFEVYSNWAVIGDALYHSAGVRDDAG